MPLCLRALVFQRPSPFGGRVGEGGLRGLSRCAVLKFNGLMVGSCCYLKACDMEVKKKPIIRIEDFQSLQLFPTLMIGDNTNIGRRKSPTS